MSSLNPSETLKALVITRLRQLVTTEIILPKNSTNNIFNFKDEPRLRNVFVNKIYVIDQQTAFQYNGRQLLNSFELSQIRATIVNTDNVKIIDDLPINLLGAQFNTDPLRPLIEFEPVKLDLSKSSIFIDNLSFINLAIDRSILFAFNVIK